MEVVDNKYLKYFINKGQGSTKICNQDLFNVFFDEISKINHDGTKSKLDIGISYKLVLESNQNDKLRMIFDLWDSQVNIYLGQEEVHYADDAEIKSKYDILEFKEKLALLLSSSIEENLYYKNGQLKKYKYQFYPQRTKEQLIFSNQSILSFSSIPKREVKNNYKPWLEILS